MNGDSRSFDCCLQLFGAALGVGNEAGAHWNVLAEGICLWEVRASVPLLM